MADDVTLNAGSGGDVIATEDIAGVEYQRVKLVDGTAASTTTIPLSGDLTNGLDVDVTRVSGTVTVDGSGVTQPVSAASLPLPSGAATAASQLADGHNVTIDNASGASAVNIQDGGNSITVDGTITANAGTGTMTVDLGVNNDVSLNAGSNTIGEVTIGAATTAAGDLAKAVNAAAGASDVGVVTLAIRDDALTTLTPIDGDYTPLRTNSTGALHVTGGGGGTEYTEDVATANPIVGSATLMERDDALSTLTPIEGDWAGMRCDSQGALWVNVVNADGTSAIDTASGGADTGAVMLAIRDDALTTLTPVDGDYVGLRTNSTGALHVTGGGGGTEYVVNAPAPADPTGSANLMERDDALSALTEIEGDWTNQRANANGALWTAVDGTVTVDGSAVTQPISGAVTANLSATDNAVLDQIELNTSYGDNTGGGTETGALRVTLANNSTGVLSIDDNGGSITIDGTVTANAGTGTMTVDLGANNDVALNAGSNLVGDIGLSGARTSGGTTLYKNIDVDETEDAVKATAGQVYWIHAINTTDALIYLKFYNATVASVTVGTTVPDLTFPVPAATTGAGFTLTIPNGIEFGTAITIAATTGVADNDSGAPGANAIIVNLGYA